MKTLIVCVGNERECDDGVGARVGRILQALPLSPEVTVVPVQRIGIQLIDALAEAEQLVVVDALTTEVEPGACTVADVRELPAGAVGSGCVHSSSVVQIVELARHVACDDTLQYLTVAGVERGWSITPEGEWSDEVAAAVPRLVDLILLAIGERLETRKMVRDTWRRLCGSVASPSWYQHTQPDASCWC